MEFFFRTLLIVKFIASGLFQILDRIKPVLKITSRFFFSQRVHFGSGAYLTPYSVCNLGPCSSGKEAGGMNLSAHLYLVPTVNVVLFLHPPIWHGMQSEGQLYLYVNLCTDWPLYHLDQHRSDNSRSRLRPQMNLTLHTAVCFTDTLLPELGSSRSDN